MSRKIGNAQSRATFFRHSAALSLPAVLLRKLPILSIFRTATAKRFGGKRPAALLCSSYDLGIFALSTEQSLVRLRGCRSISLCVAVPSPRLHVGNKAIRGVVVIRKIMIGHNLAGPLF